MSNLENDKNEIDPINNSNSIDVFEHQHCTWSRGIHRGA